MKLFGRKKENTDVPADLQQYYTASGSGVGTWIKRIGLFVVVLAVLVGSGVWLFNKLSSSDEPAPQASTSQNEAERRQAADDKAKADAEAKQAADEARKKTAEAEAKAAEAKKKAEDEAKKQAAASGVAEGTTTAPTPAETQDNQTPSPSPSPGSDSATPNPAPAATAELPNSGPGAVIASVFTGASVLGAVLHSLYTRRRLRM